MNNLPTFIFSSLLTALPLILIGSVGMVLSHTKLRQASAKAGRLAALGFGLIAVQALLGSLMRAYILNARADGAHPEWFANGLSITALVTNILLWIALVLLMLAVLADRKSGESLRGAI